ncbi:unnamed protein product [Diamesa tonsa]
MKKNNYIKYTKAELDKYVNTPESCVNRVKSSEEISIMPWLMNDLQKSIVTLLSEKIGKFSNKLDGVVLDFRNTRVLSNTSVVRQDSPSSTLEVETNFYVFSPKKGAVIKGIIKHIGVTNMGSNISVVIYRVFNVKITIKGRIPKHIETNTEIQIKIKDFHFENEIPYIEGEIVDTELFKGKKIVFDDCADSGISESSVSSTIKEKKVVTPKKITIKQEKEEQASSLKSTSKKRKLSDDFEIPAAKLIKKELFSSQEMASPQIKKERTESTSSQSSASEQKKSKKSKKSRKDSSDDFSQSILEMLDTSTTTTSKAKKQKKTIKTESSDEDDFSKSISKILNSTSNESQEKTKVKKAKKKRKTIDFESSIMDLLG